MDVFHAFVMVLIEEFQVLVARVFNFLDQIGQNMSADAHVQWDLIEHSLGEDNPNEFKELSPVFMSFRLLFNEESDLIQVQVAEKL